MPSSDESRITGPDIGPGMGPTQKLIGLERLQQCVADIRFEVPEAPHLGLGQTKSGTLDVSARTSCSQSVMLLSCYMGETPRRLCSGFCLLQSTARASFGNACASGKRHAASRRLTATECGQFGDLRQRSGDVVAK